MSITLLACGEDVTAPVADPGEYLGGREVSGIVWSLDGSEIFFDDEQQGAQRALHAVNVRTRAVRTISSAGAVPFSLAPDGRHLYGTGSVADALLRIDLTTGEAASIPMVPASSSCPASAAACSHGLVVSPDARRVAFSRSDSLFVAELADGSVRFLAKGNPFAFSPDGQQLLYESHAAGLCVGSDDDFCRLEIQPVSGGGAEGFDLDRPPVKIMRVRWDAGGVKLLRASGIEVVDVRDLTTGATTTIWQARRGVESLFSPAADWSSDGTRVAFWGSLCSIFGDCPEGATTLHVVGLAAARDSVVARLSSDAGPMAFSPDGRSIAYVSGGSIFLRAAP